MTAEQLDEIEKLAEAQELLRAGSYALPLVKAVREARDVSEGRREEAFAWTSAYFEEQRKRDEACAEVGRLKAELKKARETVQQVHALADAAMLDEWCVGIGRETLREILELTKGVE